MKISKEAREAAAAIAYSLDQDGLADGSYFGSLLATKLQSLINSTLDRAAEVARQGQPDDWQPCERTVTEIAAYLEQAYPHSASADFIRKHWGKPDPAEALVKEWLERSGWEDLGVRLAVEQYTRHLINTERLRT